jgi:hypothetical protein
MIPQTTDFLDLFSTDHRRRESVAAAERLRGPGFLRGGAASALRGLADRLAPVPAPPRVVRVPAAVHRTQPAPSRCQRAA